MKPDRREYMRAYHAAHREEQNAKNLARYHANKHRYRRPKRDYSKQREYRRSMRLELKLVRHLGVTMAEARRLTSGGNHEAR